VLGPMKRWLITPTLTWGGDMLGRIPDRWRPPIRTRDRIAKFGPIESDPDVRRPAWVSPIGLEPVTNDPGPELSQDQ
jgi:hypothetical protein